MKKMQIKESFTSKKFKNGAYTTGITVVVIGILLFINLIAGKLDIKFDLSEDKKYTLTKETKELADGIADTISIYYIAGEETANSQVKNIVEKYDGLTKKIKVEQKDPVLYPNFTGQYTKEQVDENSVIVVNETKEKSKYIPFAEMLVTETDYQTYATNVTAIDVEGKITSALQYVTSEKLPVMYTTAGHGELAVSEAAANAIAKQNVEVNPLDTLKEKSIPEDCAVLFINGPQYDFSETEADLVKEYLTRGGNAIIMTGYTAEKMPNLDSLLAHYGVERVEGIVVEGSSEYCMADTPTYLMPAFGTSEIVSNLESEKRPVVLPLAQGFAVLDTARDGITATPLLTTSDASFSKVDVNSSNAEKESGDIEGPFPVGLLIEEEYNGKTAKLALYGTPYLLDQSMTAYSQLGNVDLFLNTIKSMVKIESGISIPSRSLGNQYLTVNALEGNILGMITMIFIPVVVLCIGIVICLRRRKA